MGRLCTALVAGAEQEQEQEQLQLQQQRVVVWVVWVVARVQLLPPGQHWQQGVVQAVPATP